MVLFLHIFDQTEIRYSEGRFYSEMRDMIEKQIEFDKVKKIWSDLAITSATKKKIEEKWIILEESTLRKEMRDTGYARQMIEQLGNPPLQDVSEIMEILCAAEKGDCLSPYQLERVLGILIILDRLASYLERGKLYQNPLAYYDENLNKQEGLREEITSQIRGEKVDDHASKILFEIRMKIMQKAEEMKQKAEQVMRSNASYMADSYYTTRNGRICIPVKKEYRYKVNGSVIDKSSTGSTVFIEPDGVAKIAEQIQILKIDEENEEYRILYTLTAMVAECAEALVENMRLIESLDYFFSKGKLSLELNCVEPNINLGRTIVLDEARHPLMNPNVNVPLNFQMGEGIRGIVITGPNTGGKTVAIKTVMLNAIMAQCGLHVCCKQANICMNSDYFCDIGDGQNLSENLSTFSAHIKNVLEILNEVDEDSFVIMDELGSGTDPAEGMGIAIAILEKLRESGANFLVTTHYPEVKEYAEKKEAIVNARMTFDKETLRPTYEMVIGEAGESCAFYIAEKLGMPEEMLKVAERAAYGKHTSRQKSESKADFLTAEEDAGNVKTRKKEAEAHSKKIKKTKPAHVQTSISTKFQIGDSVIVYPDKKIGIVCEPINEKGVMRVQIAGRKIWVNHKRVKLHVKAEELYPEDYDMSIVFDSVENRKVRHDMERKYTIECIKYDKDDE